MAESERVFEVTDQNFGDEIENTTRITSYNVCYTKLLRDIVASMGLYPDGDLQAYVQELGEELAARSERPDLPWTFRVLDDPVINAFALPGGYIYVTRGLLAYLDSEAELAGVLGHEIGHVTARHSVNQISRAQVAQLGLGVGMILAPELQQFEGLASASLGLLFLKFGRDRNNFV